MIVVNKYKTVVTAPSYSNVCRKIIYMLGTPNT